MERCPFCGGELGALGRYCHECERYTDEGESSPPSLPADRIPDTRSEDQRKHDARGACEALGWWVIDLEQGWRPKACPKCKAPIPGGSRVVLGLADWLCLKSNKASFIEWKDEKGKQSDDQKIFEQACKVGGVPYQVCRTTQDAMDFLRKAGQAC